MRGGEGGGEKKKGKYNTDETKRRQNGLVYTQSRTRDLGAVRKKKNPTPELFFYIPIPIHNSFSFPRASPFPSAIPILPSSHQSRFRYHLLGGGPGKPRGKKLDVEGGQDLCLFLSMREKAGGGVWGKGRNWEQPLLSVIHAPISI